MFTEDQDDEREEPVQGFYPFQRGDKWFAVDTARKIELAPVFDTEATAEEVGRKCFATEPFFDRIPCVPMGTEFPRPIGVVWKPHKPGNAPAFREKRERRVLQHRPGDRAKP